MAFAGGLRGGSGGQVGRWKAGALDASPGTGDVWPQMLRLRKERSPCRQSMRGGGIVAPLKESTSCAFFLCFLCLVCFVCILCILCHLGLVCLVCLVCFLSDLSGHHPSLSLQSPLILLVPAPVRRWAWHLLVGNFFTRISLQGGRLDRPDGFQMAPNTDKANSPLLARIRTSDSGLVTS